MMVFWLLAGCVFMAFFAIQIITFMAIERPTTSLKKRDSDSWPKVSVLLAARDEADKIIRCLEHLEQLDYPKDSIEIWIGDDQSQDDTSTLARAFISGKPQFHLVNIEGTLGDARGKANVLAHLAHRATGEYLFITDVDVAVTPQWIKGLLAEFEPEVGIVSGTTYCLPGNLFDTMQSIDWLHFMGYIKAFANIGVSCTSVGNNMAVRTEAYWQTGGYEKMKFSITEDYRLFEQVTQRGWQWRNVLNPDTLGRATAIHAPLEMLHQRKRWLIGARDLPINWKAMILLYGCFLPVLIWMAVEYPIGALGCWALKSLIQMLFIRRLCNLASIPKYSVRALLLYEFYVVFNTLITAIFYFLPIKTIWKRRVYSQADLT